MCSQLDEHNLFRIRTMSLNALQRRIYTIQRCDKLQSFIQVPTKKSLCLGSHDKIMSYKKHLKVSGSERCIGKLIGSINSSRSLEQHCNLYTLVVTRPVSGADVFT